MGDGREGAADALDGGGELAMELRRDGRRDLGAGAAEARRRVRDDQAARPGDGLEHARQIERQERAQVDDLGADPVCCERFGGGERVEQCGSPGDDGDVRARAFRVRQPDRDAVLGLRDLRHGTRVEEERHALDEDDGIVVLDGAQQEALGVQWVARGDDLEARDVHEPRLEGLRVLRPGLRAFGGAQHERHARAAARHVAELRCVVGELVQADAEEVHEHELGNRAQAFQRGSDGGADDRRLRDRRSAHTLDAVAGREALGHREHATDRIVDVLA